MEKGPDKHGEEVTEAIVEEILPAVMVWARADESERDTYQKSLFSLLDNYYDDDGYQLARQLDNDGWEADAELVGILDQVSLIRSCQYAALRMRWVVSNAITIPFELGDTVQPSGHGRKLQVVVKLMPNTAEVGLADERSPLIARWTIYPAEDVILVEKATAKT